MKYLRVRWHHEDIDDPTLMFSEEHEAHYQVRKVDIFLDGRVAIAFDEFRMGSTWLGHGELPSLEEYNESGEFEAEWITAQEFEAEWVRAVAAVKAQGVVLPAPWGDGPV